MRFKFKSSVAKFAVLAVLLTAVACSELPELARLMDNPTNDFTAPSYLMEDISASVAAQVTATAPTLRITLSQKFSDSPQRATLIRGSRDLLLLCSILRT